MEKSLPVFLREAADAMRVIALSAPDIANELRRFADDLEQEAQQAERNNRSQRGDAAD